MSPSELRQRASQMRCETTDDGKTAEMLEDAADEIDRLRRERDNLRDAIGGIGKQAAEIFKSYR